MSRTFFTIAFLILVSLTVHGQVLNVSEGVLSKYVAPAPDVVFEMFHKAGMSPVNHALTDDERAQAEAAFALLPPLHRKVLSDHLHSISFMDNMPNTALTSPVLSRDSVKWFHITFRAGIFRETISEWATKKENTLYEQTGNTGYTVTVVAGQLDAFVYVLLHEATHVLDAILKITPSVENATDSVAPTAITKGIWDKMNVPVRQYTDSLVEKTMFRGGGRISLAAAPDIYRTLSKMPFVSLYGTASWSEDIAELETIYHLTHKMKQPFYILVKKGASEVVRYEPMKNKLVKRRLSHLKSFYH